MSHHLVGQNIHGVTHSHLHKYKCNWRSFGCGVIPETSVLFATLCPPKDHDNRGHIWRKLIDFPKLRGGWGKTDCESILWSKSNPSCWICQYVHIVSLLVCLLWKKINYRRSIRSFFLAASSCAVINVMDLENERYFLTFPVRLQSQWNS